jgi:ABC-type antimicrobial peptide transport system permease subunit
VNIFLNFKEAMVSLSANKMRSLLTILGIVIGVASVIALLSLGESAGASITGEIESIGTNVIYVLRGNSNEDVSNPKDLTLRDSQALAASTRATEIAYVAPVFTGSAEMTYSNRSASASILGITPDYQFVQNITMAEGEFISAAQVEGRSAVVVLGPSRAQQLLGRSSGVVGNTVRMAATRIALWASPKPKVAAPSTTRTKTSTSHFDRTGPPAAQRRAGPCSIYPGIYCQHRECRPGPAADPPGFAHNPPHSPAQPG